MHKDLSVLTNRTQSCPLDPEDKPKKRMNPGTKEFKNINEPNQNNQQSVNDPQNIQQLKPIQQPPIQQTQYIQPNTIFSQKVQTQQQPQQQFFPQQQANLSSFQGAIQTNKQDSNDIQVKIDMDKILKEKPTLKLSKKPKPQEQVIENKEEPFVDTYVIKKITKKELKTIPEENKKVEIINKIQENNQEQIIEKIEEKVQEKIQEIKQEKTQEKVQQQEIKEEQQQLLEQEKFIVKDQKLKLQKKVKPVQDEKIIEQNLQQNNSVEQKTQADQQNNQINQQDQQSQNIQEVQVQQQDNFIQQDSQQQQLQVEVQQTVKEAELEDAKLQVKITSELIYLLKEKFKNNFQSLTKDFFTIIDRNKKLFDQKNKPVIDDKIKEDDFWKKKPVNPEQDKLKQEAKIRAELMKQIPPAEKKLIQEIKFELNKLTADNFNAIKLEILKLAKQEGALDKVVSAIIEKAWVEKKFAKIYAQLCYFLQNCDDFSVNEDESKKKKKKNLFKNTLIQKIQETFEGTYDVMMSINNQKDYKDFTPEEKIKYEQKKKMKILGNVNFIGELYITKVISSQVINIINKTKFAQFLNDYQSYLICKQDEFKNFEDHLEGIINLNSKVGFMIEDKKQDAQNIDQIKERQEIDNLIENMNQIQKNLQLNNDTTINIDLQLLSFNGAFEVLQHIQKNLNIQNRFVCLVENLFEKRQNNWIESVFIEKGPSTKEDILNEHINKNVQQIEEAKNPKGSKVQQKYTKSIIKEPTKEQIQVNKEVKQEQENKLSEKEFTDKLNDDYKKLNEEKQQQKYEGSDEIQTVTYTFEDFHKDQINNIKSTSQKLYLNKLINTFYNDKQIYVQKRIPIFQLLQKDNLITINQFLDEYNLFIQTAHLIFSDFPNLTQNMAEIYINFVQDELLTYDKIDYKPDSIKDEDDRDEYKYFFEQLLMSFIKQLKLKGKDLNCLKTLSISIKNETWFNQKKGD